ncbi:MAG: sensor histidine kinase [Acidimicrobiia bacterium]
MTLRSQFLAVVVTPLAGVVATVVWTSITLRGVDRLSGSQRLMMIIGLLATAAACALAGAIAFRSIRKRLINLNAATTQAALIEVPQALATIASEPLRTLEIPAIPVDGSDEIGDLAAAINSLQEGVVKVARDQASIQRHQNEMIVALGRRNQALLGDQLDLITSLERDETDAEALGYLFQLDHLATRIRRNAENLLTLTGTDTGRAWQIPVALSDIVRAALSEVADYKRVNVDARARAWVIGSIAPDLTHLLAELVENALVFSPTDRFVDIVCHATSAGATIQVVDRGAGMDPVFMRQVDRRMQDPADTTNAPGLRGLYLVGCLAQRHGLTVAMSDGTGGGLVATVQVPAGALAAEIAVRPLAADRSAHEAPPAPTADAATDEPGSAVQLEFPTPDVVVDAEPEPVAPLPVAAPAASWPAPDALVGTMLPEPAAVAEPALVDLRGATLVDPLSFPPAPVAPSIESTALAAATAHVTRAGLPIRQRTVSSTNHENDGLDLSDATSAAPAPADAETPTPEAVRERLTRFRTGVLRGRNQLTDIDLGVETTMTEGSDAR